MHPTVDYIPVSWLVSRNFSSTWAISGVLDVMNCRAAIYVTVILRSEGDGICARHSPPATTSLLSALSLPILGGLPRSTVSSHKVVSLPLASQSVMTET